MLGCSIELHLEHGFTLTPTFADRGIPDTYGYARLFGLGENAEIEACAIYRYAPIVFTAPPWEEIYGRDHERRQDSPEAEIMAIDRAEKPAEN